MKPKIKITKSIVVVLEWIDSNKVLNRHRTFGLPVGDRLSNMLNYIIKYKIGNEIDLIIEC